jgi:hypothetical protein
MNLIDQIAGAGFELGKFLVFLVFLGIIIGIKNELVEAWKRGRKLKKLKKL